MKKLVGHGGKERNPFPFSLPTLSSSCSSCYCGFWGLRAITNLEIIAPESFNFPTFLSIGSNMVFSSSFSSSSSPLKSLYLSTNYSSKSRERNDDDVDESVMVCKVEAISFTESKRLMRLVNVETLKTRLGAEGKEVISYCELLEACESRVARSSEKAAAFAQILDEAGVILLFQDKDYLHPDKVKDCSFLLLFLIWKDPFLQNQPLCFL